MNHMRRRHFLATAALTSAGPLAGCLGSGADDGSPSDDDDDDEQSGDDGNSDDGESPSGDENTKVDQPPGDGIFSCNHEALPGRLQWRYDACNSGYAAGISGPSEAPSFQRMYQGVSAAPLTANDTLYTSTWSAPIGGDGGWNVEEPSMVSDAQALYEESVLGVVWEPFTGFWALSAEDGSEQWRTEFSQRVVSPITVHGDRAYFAIRTGIGCVDLANQERAWMADLDAEFPYLLESDLWYVPAVTSSHVFALTNIDGKDRNFDEDPRQLFALEPETGELAWTVPLDPEEQWITWGPFVGDGLVFITAHVETPDAASNVALRVIAVDPAAREVAWRETLSGRIGASIPATANGRFYVAHGGAENVPNQLVALDTADGSVDWRTELNSTSMIPTVTEEAIVASDAGDLRSFDPETGDSRWEVDYVGQITDHTDLDSSTFGRSSPFLPVVHDGRIFLYLGEGRIVEFA